MNLRSLWNKWFVEAEIPETAPPDQDYEGRQEPPLPVTTAEPLVVDAASADSSPPEESV